MPAAWMSYPDEVVGEKRKVEKVGKKAPQKMHQEEKRKEVGEESVGVNTPQEKQVTNCPHPRG